MSFPILASLTFTVIAALCFLDRPPPGSLIPSACPVVSPEVQSRKGERNSVGHTLGTTLLPSFLLCSWPTPSSFLGQYQSMYFRLQLLGKRASLLAAEHHPCSDPGTASRLHWCRNCSSRVRWAVGTGPGCHIGEDQHE